MNAPRDHHFVPAFYLSQWTNTSGKLVEYTIPYRTVVNKEVGPRSTGYEYDLYAFDGLPTELTQYLEKYYFDYADRVASEALSNHLSAAPTAAWTAEIISAWSRLIVDLHLRHPDTMPELRTIVERIWKKGDLSLEKEYQSLRQPTGPSTLDGYLESLDPHSRAKAHLTLIIGALDNEIIGQHINNMKWAVIDVSAASFRLLTSDRPVNIFNIKKRDGMLSLPISPTKIFVAVNEQRALIKLRNIRPDTIVKLSNKFVVGRARKYVWALDISQTRFVRNNMSKTLETTPFFPSAARE